MMVIRMKVIGITGGVGSGKSLVTEILKEQYGALILNTDLIAKKQMEIGGESYSKVVDYFGKEILCRDGSIDRNKLAGIVFVDEEKLKKLNQITHPTVIEAVQKEIDQKRNEGIVPYIVIETALMIEAGLDYICNEVWYIYSSEQDRRVRLKANRNYSDEKIDSIFQSQSKDAEFRSRYRNVIENCGDINQISEQVEALIKK